MTVTATAGEVPPNPSFWFDLAGTVASGPRLEGTVTADVCIIGAGMTGLSTAYHLITRSPGLVVRLVEARQTGFGASGRNAGQIITSFGGGDLGMHIRRRGAENMALAFDYVAEGSKGIRDTAASESFDCSFAPTGTLKVGMRNEGSAEIDRYLELLEKIGQGRHFTAVPSAQVAQELQTDVFSEGIHDPRGGQFNPLRFVRGLKDALLRRGVHLHESSPVTAIDPSGKRIKVLTAHGAVLCDKLVVATNGFTHRLPGAADIGLARGQMPLIVRAAVTGRISDGDWARAGWPRRSGVNVVSRLFHSFAPTPDNRLLWVGGYNTFLPRTDAPLPENFGDLAQGKVIGTFFPQLAALGVTREWGGPISITADETPQIGVARDERVLFAWGCWGSGMPLGFRNGKTLADLALSPAGESSRLWFVSRTKRKWPVIASRWVAGQFIRQRHRHNFGALRALGLNFGP